MDPVGGVAADLLARIGPGRCPVVRPPAEGRAAHGGRPGSRTACAGRHGIAARGQARAGGDCANSRAGTCSSALFPTADSALVPRTLAAFRDRHPGIRLSREEGLTPRLLGRLASGHLDLAIVSTTGRAPLEAYELYHLLDESLYVAVPTSHPLAGQGPCLAQLADSDWISGSAHPEGTLLEAALREGFRPRIAHVVGEWTAKEGYVAAGLGVTLVPALAADSRYDRMSCCCRCWTRGHRRAGGVRGDGTRPVTAPGDEGVPRRAHRGGGADRIVRRTRGVDHSRHAILRPSGTAPHCDGRPQPL
ncbi:LysR substrate-binding domain-containing protein [Streptomyces sp. L7]